MANNKKVFAAIGCGCGGLILAGIVGVAFIVFGAFGLMKKSEPYAESLQRAQSHPAAVAALGTPVEAGFLVSGSVNLENQDGTAELDYAVSGPSGKGNVSVRAAKQGGAWQYEQMVLTLDSGETIDLLSAP